MRFKFQYRHAQLGTVDASEPEGWGTPIMGYARDKTYSSLIGFFRTTLNAYGSDGFRNGQREFFKKVRRLYGVDAQLEMLVSYSRDGLSYKQIYLGLVPISLMIENLLESHDINFNPTAIGLWQTFIAGIENKVNIQSPLSIDGKEVNIPSKVTVPMLPQVLDQYAEYQQEKYWNYGRQFGVSETFPSFQVDIPVGGLAGVDMAKEVLKEIGTRASIPIAPIELGQRVFPIYIMDYAGVYDFDIKLNLTLFQTNTSDAANTAYKSLGGKIRALIQFNDEAPIEFARADKEAVVNWPIPLVGSQIHRWSEYTYVASRTLQAKDCVRIYLENISGATFGYGNNTITISVSQLYLLGSKDNHNPMQPALDDRYPGDFLYPATPRAFYKYFTVISGIESYIKILGHTTFPETNVDGFLPHDVAAAICERITGVKNSFHSDYFGNLRTSMKSYGAIGCGSEVLQAKGLQIRGYTLVEKPFFGSMKEFWDNWNPVHNLGMSYSKKIVEDEEVDVIEIEEKKKFFDDSEVSILLLNIGNNISQQYADKDYSFTKCEAGYDKWESENASGIDDAQTKRTLNTILRTFGTVLTFISKIIAASLTIETTRRKSTEKTKDYKYDNNDFAIDLVEDGAGYKPRVNEGFSDVSNLNNSASRYNKGLTVYRNIVRWLNFISCGLQDYLGSVIAFGSGEGNFDMVATMDGTCGGTYYNQPLSEKSDLPVSGDPLFVASPITIYNHPMGMEEYLSWESKRHKAIGFSQTESSIKKAFVFDIQYNFLDGTATLKICSKTKFEIRNPSELGVVGEPYTRIFDPSFGPDFE